MMALIVVFDTWTLNLTKKFVKNVIFVFRHSAEIISKDFLGVLLPLFSQLFFRSSQFHQAWRLNCSYACPTIFFSETFLHVKFVIPIYSDICSCKIVDTNIFRYSFVSKFSRMSHSGSHRGQYLPHLPLMVEENYYHIIRRK